jgi:hypothetical protein
MAFPARLNNRSACEPMLKKVMRADIVSMRIPARSAAVSRRIVRRYIHIFISFVEPY